ncbi:MAG: hypothetical protein PHY64_01280 [Eubacteriales bacterium]|nr:hypothetical protein [Eubacteriales bacterium]
MSNYHEILQAFTMDEFVANEQEKQAFRACAELLLNTSEDYATATTLAMLLLANKPGGFTPGEDFVEAHPDNQPKAYSSMGSYIAFYLLYLCEKARSVKEISDESDHCTHYSVSCAGDTDVCGRCEDRAELDIPIALMRYEDVPPYHLGCRCRPLLRCLK